MNIVVILRTRDEEQNIARFCTAYRWADKILIADGGSTDRTKEIALTFPNVVVQDYTVRKEMKNGLWRNPEAEHFTFLVEWAKSHNPDWIVQDDCDCVPNKYLQVDARNLLETTPHAQAYVLRLYLWRDGLCFINTSQPTVRGVWETSMWAWKPNEVDMKFTNSTNAFEFTPLVEEASRLNVLPPYCDLHYTWSDEDAMRAKLDFYEKSGQIPGIRHPLEWAGEPVPSPDWATLE
jgi:hypothetical protein